MPHDTPFIATIAIGLGLAFLFGLAAQRFRLPPIVGYLAAGIAAGPFTPGYVADPKIATELAEMGVILLMFGVGLHFSLKDLLSVRAIAIPGAVGQIAVATLLGMGLAHAMGWPFGAGIVFGLALSVASTVVLLRALQERRLVETERGRIAVGWLIVEDLAMVLALVLLPPLAGLLGGTPAQSEAGIPLLAPLGLGPVGETLLVTAAKVALFVAFMLVVGRRAVPAVLHYVAHTGSRELVPSVGAGDRTWVWRTEPPTCSASPLHSAPSSRAWCWRNHRSAARPRAKRCRCAMPSPCSSSCPSECSSILSRSCASRCRSWRPS